MQNRVDVDDFIQKLVNKNGTERYVLSIKENSGQAFLLIRPLYFMTEFLMTFMAMNGYSVSISDQQHCKSGCDCKSHNYRVSHQVARQFQHDFNENNNGIKDEWGRSLRAVTKAVYLLKKSGHFPDPHYVRGHINFIIKTFGIKREEFLSTCSIMSVMNENIVDAYTAGMIADVTELKRKHDTEKQNYQRFISILTKYPELYHYKLENHHLVASTRLVGVPLSRSKMVYNPVTKNYESILPFDWFGTVSDDVFIKLEALLSKIIKAKDIVQPFIDIFQKNNLICYFGFAESCRPLSLLCFVQNGPQKHMISVLTKYFPDLVQLFNERYYEINFTTIKELNATIFNQFANAVDERAKFIGIYVRLQKRYGNKVKKLIGIPLDHPAYVERLIELGEDHLNLIEQQCICEEEQVVASKKKAEDNLQILVSALSPLIKAENWCKDTDKYFAAVDRKSQALIACLNITGLALTADGVSIAKDQLSMLVGVSGLAYRVQRLLKSIALLDTIICQFRDHNVLDKTKTRDYDEGFVFAFRSDHELKQFPLKGILQKTAIPGLFIIPYATCLGNDVSLELLQASLREIIQQRAKTQSVETEVKVKKPKSLAKIVVNHPPAVVARPAKSKPQKPKSSKPAAVKATSSKKSPTVSVPTASKSTPKKPQFFQTRASMVQDSRRGLMPARERDSSYVATDLAKFNQDQLAFTTFAEAREAQVEKKTIKQHRNAHQGAIQYELEFLTCSDAWFQQLEVKEVLYQKIHHYNGWFSATRLMNALGMRLELLPQCMHVTHNDKATMSARADLLHRNPGAAFIYKLRDYINQHRLSDSLVQVFDNVDVRSQCDINLFFNHNFQRDDRPLNDLIAEVFTDLCLFVGHFDYKTRENPELANEMGSTNILYFESRAIQACIVKLGEYYKQAKDSDIKKSLADEVSMFMRSCQPPRNVGTHNNVYNHTFDPISLPEMLRQARQGKFVWERCAAQSRLAPG